MLFRINLERILQVQGHIVRQVYTFTLQTLSKSAT